MSPAPSSVPRNSVQAGRRRLLLYAYGGCVPLMALLTLASAKTGRPDLAMVGATCIAISLFGWRRVFIGRNINRWGVGFLVASASMAGLAVVLSGGALSGAITWLFLLTPLAGLLFGPRGAGWTASIVGLFFVGLVVAHFQIGNWRDLETIDQAARLAGVSHTLALVLMFMLTRVTGRILQSTRGSLERARDEADQANAVKGAFLANMSHEIRTPMNGILGMAELALASKSEADRQESLETIQACAESLLAIINDILDLSKIESGLLELESVPFELEPMIEEIIATHFRSAQQRGLEFEALIDPACPQFVTGDPTRVRQILTNLVGNALKFTTEGSVSLRVDWQAEVGALRMRVLDTGIGIDPDKIHVLFDEFTQADSSTTREFGGTGLGLAITRQLTEAMQGRISVSSELGQGSCFEVWLPSASADASGLEVPSGLAGRTIAVLVDGELRRTAFELAAARVGLRACRPEDQAQADLVLSDGSAPAADDTRPHLIWPHSRVLDRAALRAELRDTLNPQPRSEAARGRARTRHEDDGARALAEIAAGFGQQPVLLVEDNPINARVARHLLERAGFVVEHVGDGAQAVEAVQRTAYACVLMDCQMPVLDGFAATQAIRSLAGPAQSVRIVAMTANAMRGDRTRCLEAGMDDYVSKPVRPPELAAALRRALRREAA